MANQRRRWRAGLRWLLTLAVIAYAVTDWGSDEEPKPAEPSDEPGITSLRITSISDADVNPGDAVVVTFQGADADPPIEAKVAGHSAPILVHEANSVVVRVPAATPFGRAGLRLSQGSRRSKAWDLHVRATNHRKLIGRLLGGLALFVYGLGLLASGVRGFAGLRVRTLLGRLTRSPTKSVGVGVLVGAVTQLTTSAAALTVSLVDARLLALAPTIGVFVGAQLGAAITGALLPVGFARESLLVIAIGVLWMRLATARQTRTVAQLVLGAGLMLYGLHLLQSSIEPLVSDPKILPYLEYLRDDDVVSKLTCAATGALLALALQGPGPVYVLVVGLAQASGALPFGNALAILAGTNLGAALGMALIAWQAGPLTRPLVKPHVLFGAFATALALVTLPIWTAIANAVMGGDSGMLEYGHTVVRTNISGRLALGFATSELAIVGLWLSVLPALTSIATRRRAVEIVPPAMGSNALLVSAQRELTRILDCHRLALDAALETSCTGDRMRAAESEEALIDARRSMELQYSAVAATPSDPQLERLSRTIAAGLQLQRAVEQLITAAELGVERGLRLISDEQTRLRAMHALARESFDAAITALECGVAPDLEAAGAREIRTNVLEAENRSVPALVGRARGSASFRFGIAELVDSYEQVGNHLFRLCKAMGDDSDDLV